MTRLILRVREKNTSSATESGSDATPRRFRKRRLGWPRARPAQAFVPTPGDAQSHPRERGVAHLGSKAAHAAERVGGQLAHETATLSADGLHAAERAGNHVIHGAARAGEEVVHAAHMLRREPFWQAQAVLLGAVMLYLGLPSKLIVGPGWLMPAVEVLLVGGLWIDRPRHSRCEAARERRIVLGLLGLVAASNFLSLDLLVQYLLHGGKAGGHQLLLSSIVIWITNVAVFALIFWQLDRGGPDRRARRDEKPPDFLFAQMTDQDLAKDWSPTFVDYLYTSFTNATAFSPTDTLPLTSVTKLLMMSQSAVSLITLALVAARAINILS